MNSMTHPPSERAQNAARHVRSAEVIVRFGRRGAAAGNTKVSFSRGHGANDQSRVRWVCAALAVLAGSATAHAGPEVAAGAPFTAEELGEALAARGVGDDVAVEAAGSDAVAVTTPDGA